MLITVSEPAARSAGVATVLSPVARALSGVRFQTITSCPTPASRAAMAAPILPMPAMPIFMRGILMQRVNCFVIGVGMNILRTALLIAVLTAGWSVAQGQSAKRLATVGVLWPNPPATFEPLRRGLSDLGYTEGRNIAFEYRWAQDRLGEVPAFAADLVQKKVDVIITLAPPATLAAKQATQTIPIVFVNIGDPLGSGLVASLAR